MANRHAPKGPIKNTDPVNPDDPMRGRCTATNRQGKRCGRWPIQGGFVCRLHGGAAPQVKAKALERLMLMQDMAITRLGQLALDEKFPSTSYQAVRDVLDRTMGRAVEQVRITADVNVMEDRLKAARERHAKRQR